MTSIRYRRRAGALAAVFSLVAAAGVAAELRVVVRDADGEPTGGALVTAVAVAGAARGAAITGTDGAATLVGLPGGRYLVSARAADLSAAPVEAVLDDGTARTVELTVRFAAVAERVVVSAALRPRREDEAGTFVDVRSAESLQARDEWFLLEGLRGIPGLLVRQNGSTGQLAALQIRGLPSASTALVVDGAPLRDASTPQSDGAVLLSSLALLGVDRVEVRRGGGSTIYGTNGSGGVLHIVTRSETAPAGGRLSVGLGGRGQAAASGEWGGGGPRGGVSAGIGHLAVREGADGEDPFANRTAVARAVWRLHPALRVSGRFLFSSASVGLNDDPFPLPAAGPGVVEARPAPGAAIRRYEEGAPLGELDLGNATFMPAPNDPDQRDETRFVSTLLRLGGAPAPDLSWTLRFHDFRTRRRNEDGPGGINRFDPPELRELRYEGGTRSAAARVERARGAGRLIAGGEIERERATTIDPAFEARLRQTSAAAFLQGEVAAGRASLRAAVRAQRFATREPVLEPAAGAPWQGSPPPSGAAALTAEASASLAVSRGFRLRASGGRGFRAPSLYERFGSWYSTFGYSVFGDPRLAPEYSVSADGGFSAETADGRRNLRGAFFWSQRRQIIAFGSLDGATDPFGRFLGYENTDGGVARGFETALRLTLPGRTRASLDYTLTEAEPPGNAPPELDSAWLIPRHQGGALLSGRVGDRFRWSADLHLAAAIHAPLFDPQTFASRVFRFPGMRRLDLALSFDLTSRLTARALVQDAFDDAAYQSGGFRPLGRVARVSLRWSPR